MTKDNAPSFILVYKSNFPKLSASIVCFKYQLYVKLQTIKCVYFYKILFNKILYIFITSSHAFLDIHIPNVIGLRAFRLEGGYPVNETRVPINDQPHTVSH